jgi:hypothetical protein
MVVDQLSASGCEPFELGCHVVDLEREVMHAGAASLEEPPDGCIGCERGEKLDPVAADSQDHRLDALARDRLTYLDLGPEEKAPRGNGFVEIGNGNADVVDSGQLHATDATVAACVGCWRAGLPS